MDMFVIFVMGICIGMATGKYVYSNVRRRIAHIHQIKIDGNKLIIDDRPSQYSDTILTQLQSLFESNVKAIDNEDSRKILWRYGLHHLKHLIERSRHANDLEALIIRLTKVNDSSSKSV